MTTLFAENNSMKQITLKVEHFDYYKNHKLSLYSMKLLHKKVVNPTKLFFFVNEEFFRFFPLSLAVA